MPSRSKLSLMVVCVLLACLPYHLSLADDHAAHSYVGSHGMALVFAPNGQLLAHHLPLYRAPHDFQIVYHVEIVNKALQGRMQALSDRDLVTVLPDNFDLRALIDGTRLTINAKVFDGHFERGGEALFDVPLTYVRPAYVRKIVVAPTDTSKKDADGARFDVIALSDTRGLAIHVIDAKPSFDTLVFVAISQRDQRLCALQDQSDRVELLTRLTECLGKTPAYLELADFR